MFEFEKALFQTMQLHCLPHGLLLTRCHHEHFLPAAASVEFVGVAGVGFVVVVAVVIFVTIVVVVVVVVVGFL